MISFSSLTTLIQKKPCPEKQQLEEVLSWIADESAYRPPACVKQTIVRTIGRTLGIKTLIESGTYLGDMVAACRDTFDTIISIELDPSLYEQAKKRFAQDSAVTILHGDSAYLLPRLVKELRSPTLFWLDAHYSGGNTAKGKKETPIMEELAAILADKKHDHTILIDDARDFTGTEGYPLLTEVKRYVKQTRPGWQCSVQHDSIRIHA